MKNRFITRIITEKIYPDPWMPSTSKPKVLYLVDLKRNSLLQNTGTNC